MHLGRSSNSQKKTRSPAPQISTPRPFLPPSYYAGVAAKSPVVRGASSNGDLAQSHKSSRAQPEALNSDSSVQARPRPKSRTPRTGFPELETQLLPSLRETVDRMTLTPSRNHKPIETGRTYDDSQRRAPPKHSARESPSMASSSAQKPSLKSAMRSPLSTPNDMQPVQPKSSLRSMKTLLSRKYSGTLKSPFKPSKEFTEDDFQSKTPTITRSNIPRPQVKPDIIRLDDSDPEHMYEANMRNRRKLTVANAEVPPSSASSESDVDSRMGTSRRNWRNDHASVGLGLSMPSSIPVPVQRNANRQEESHTMQEKTLRFSLPLSESVSSSYSDEIDQGQPSQHFSSRADVNYRTSPNIRSPAKARSPTYSVSTKEESTEYETESEREGYSFRRARTAGDRRRSSSCEPRFSFAQSSPQSGTDDGAVPVVSRSSGRSHRSPKPPSPRSARIFPENLRDLIKSRHSPSHPHRSSPDVRGTDRTRSPSRTVEAETTPKPPAAHSRQQERYRQQQYDNNKQNQSEASAIAHGYRSAVARERSAFGIPPSLSDEGSEQQLSHTESDTSSINQARWKEDESDDISINTESIFKAMKHNEKAKNKHQHDNRNNPRLSVISPTLSASSTYESRPEATPSQVDYQQTSPDRASVQHESPKTREGVIQDIFESEEELLRFFQICMRTFILPLRVQDSRSWIAGVPPNVAKLFDWFDDIVKLHELIYESLCSARDTMSPATDRVSESLRCFVLKVEVYQPYLVRLADVSTEITALVEAHDTDFGEFVALQQLSKECDGWPLGRFLMLPVNRLAAYQDLFARMLDLTPKSHQDYLSTFSLSRSTDMVIRVMTEVKVREDEFNLLKAFSSRIQGLPMSSCLATRERRLLHSGPLALVLSVEPTTSELTPQSSPRSRSGAGGSSRSDRGSRLLGTISSSTSKLFEKYHSDQTISGDLSLQSGGQESSTPAKEASSSWFSRLRRQSRVKSPLPVCSTNENIPVLTRQPTPPARNPTVSLHAFVFNDLVLLAQPLRTSKAEPQWTIYANLGVFRPLSIARLETQSSEETLVSLETMIVDPELENLGEHIDFRPSSLRTVDFLLSPERNNSFNNDDAFYATWLNALRQCSWTTLRKLTFPEGPHSGFGGLSDRTLDTQMAISSLVGSGLPIPRSPSGTFPDMYGGGNSAFCGDEREERGWWSLRYQQIFRELRRQDSLLFDDDDSTPP